MGMSGRSSGSQGPLLIDATSPSGSEEAWGMRVEPVLCSEPGHQGQKMPIFQPVMRALLAAGQLSIW